MERKATLLFIILIVILAIAGCAPAQQFRGEHRWATWYSEERLATLETYELCNIWLSSGGVKGYPMVKVYKELTKRIPETEDPEHVHKVCLSESYEEGT